jgi:hypothetical protein
MVAIPEFYKKLRASARRFEVEDLASACMKPAPVRDEEEWRKTLTAAIQAGQPLVIFGNCLPG